MKKIFTFRHGLLSKLPGHISSHSRSIILQLVTCFLLCHNLIMAQPTLVKDINAQVIQKFNPSALATVNGILYFSGYDATHGQELWRSDGTPEGTFIVKDINPGLGSSSPSHLLNVNGTLYFIANQYDKAIYTYTYTGGYQLWKTDGTLAGTQKVIDVGLGRWEIEDGGPMPIVLTKAGNTVFYSSGNNPYEYTLASTGGVSIGIQRGFEDEEETAFTEVNNTLYISGVTSYGNALIKTDGTEKGTSLVKEYAGALPRNLSSSNGILFFTLNDPINGQTLWKSDGTPTGTVFLKKFPGINYSFQFGSPTSMNGTLYFSAQSVLWKSDGTPTGTVPVKEFASNSFVNSLRAVNGTLFFIANDGISGWALWKSNGTSAGTTLVKAISKNNGISIGIPSNGFLYFSTYENYPSRNFSLWRSDGTTAGTFKLVDFTNSINQEIRYYTDVNGKMYFVPDYNDLWKSDGTVAGTVKINIPLPGGTSSQDSNPQHLISTSSNLYFGTSDGVNGQELWKSDGTEAGTVLVKDINPGPASGNPQYLAAINNIVYFAANEGVNDQELWKSDGTTAGTVLVKDINPGPEGSQLKNLINVNGTLFFTAYHPSYGEELWKSNGTSAGTILIKDIYSGTTGSGISNIVQVNGTLFFTANNGTNGQELWKSDGTAAGTILIKDINPGIGCSCPEKLVSVNGTLFFTADNGTNGRELWKSDGNQAGTVMVKDLMPGRNGYYPKYLVAGNGLLYFIFNNPTEYREELWKSDGTAAGTTLFWKFPSDASYSEIENLTYVNGNLYFFNWRDLDDSSNGFADLWKIEESAQAKATKLKEGFVGNLSGPANNPIFNRNGILYFVKNDGIHGNDLWRSDGTIAGTALVEDLPGAYIYSDLFTTLNNTLYFKVFTPKTGVELWKYNAVACTFLQNRNLSVAGSTVCIGQDGIITLKASETNVRYQVYINNAPLGLPVMGGGDITLTIPAVSLSLGNNIFTIRATGCTSSELSSTVMITVTASCDSSLCSATGSILQEKWLNVTGSLVSNIPLTLPPTTSAQLTSFETTSNQGNNYGQRIRGYLCVPQNGTYTFYIAGDDNAELYLSTDENPANKTRIASITGNNRWTLPQQWTKFSSQKSASISLVAGKKYYIEALHKEGLYSDNLAVGWQSSATSPITVIPGSVLSPYVPQVTGKISREYWANVTGALVSEIPLNTTPTTISEITSFESATNAGNNYGQRIRGYVHPQVSGAYRFFIAGDDRCELWLSSDQDPSKKVKIASVPYFTGVREWNKYSAQQSAEIALVAGRKYYIEALHKEGLYSDNLAVGWIVPNQSTIAVITGNYLSPFLGSPTANIARVGLEENLAGKVNLYPNPFEDKLTLTGTQAGKLYINIVDNLGRTVYQTMAQADTELNLAHLKAGVYIIKVSAEDGTNIIQKVIKR